MKSTVLGELVKEKLEQLLGISTVSFDKITYFCAYVNFHFLAYVQKKVYNVIHLSILRRMSSQTKVELYNIKMKFTYIPCVKMDLLFYIIGSLAVLCVQRSRNCCAF
jgi:hypothetical protein